MPDPAKPTPAGKPASSGKPTRAAKPTEAARSAPPLAEQPEPTPPYDRDAIFQHNGPFSPSFMAEAIRALMRTLPLDPTEPQGWQDRRMHSALLGLAALHARDEIEVMLGVQAMSAYHAAASCWRIGMNLRRPNGDSTRHISAAASAARTFDSMLRAIERRQAKPLAVPVGRPAVRSWDDIGENPTEVMRHLADRCLEAGNGVGDGAAEATEPHIVWTDEDITSAHEFLDRERIEKENEGLDIANTEGILPGGGMIVTEDPTPQQAAYLGRRIGLQYRKEFETNRLNGIHRLPKIRPIRPGDLIP
jgi:hypothetical protein